MAKKNLMALRRMHGAVHEWNEVRKEQQHLKNLIKTGRKKSLEREKEVAHITEDYPVDIVVTWVDGSDPAWQAERNKYMPNASSKLDTVDARFREWGIFQYWFRAVEKYAPWVNHVYLVTWGHVPSWLNMNNPKLKVVKHSEFIPEEYLPTFSSHTIEMNLWRIPGLSEHFIYFNDDMFLMKKVEKSDFFCNGLPKYCAIAKPMFTFLNMNSHRHARLNNFGIVNAYFDIHQCIEDHPEKWFNYKYYDDVKYNVRVYEDKFICGMHYFHVGLPFRKSTMKDFSEHYPERVRRTCLNRFRTSDDYMHQIFQMWDIFHGNFEPVESNYYGRLFSVTKDSVEYAVEVILNGNDRMICINDHEGVDDLVKIKERIYKALEQKFPEKSSFEN